MTRDSLMSRLLFGFVVGLSLCAAVPSVLRAEPLVIATISSDPVKDIGIFKPFAAYLSDQLAGDGIDSVEVKIASSIQEMAALLKDKRVDLFFDSSVTALAVNMLSGSKYMLRRWKKGRGQYRSVIFVNEGEGINALGDLNNNLTAFEEPFSTSGFILPALVMRSQGLDLQPVENFRTSPATGKAGYVMAFDNETQMAWLDHGVVKAAAMAEDDYNEFKETALKPLMILHTTPFVPYHVVVHRPGLDAGLVRRLKTVLMGARETKQGQQTLHAFERTAKFDEIPDALMSETLKLSPFLGDVIPME